MIKIKIVNQRLMGEKINIISDKHTLMIELLLLLIRSEIIVDTFTE